MKKLIAERLCYIYQSKYQKVEALKNVDCEFETGKLYAIVGQSGSGKTTLLSMLAGLGNPTSGTISIDNHIITEHQLEEHRRVNVSVIFQSFHLFPTLTVIENVMYPLEIVQNNKKYAKEKAREALDMVGLPQIYDSKYPAMLSGGEQQRVAIARSLVKHGSFILADEPTGNLDSENSDNILSIFKELVKNEYCVIIVTHDLDIAEKADVVYKMKDGYIIT